MCQEYVVAFESNLAGLTKKNDKLEESIAFAVRFKDAVSCRLYLIACTQFSHR